VSAAAANDPIVAAERSAAARHINNLQ